MYIYDKIKGHVSSIIFYFYFSLLYSIKFQLLTDKNNLITRQYNNCMGIRTPVFKYKLSVCYRILSEKLHSDPDEPMVSLHRRYPPIYPESSQRMEDETIPAKEEDENITKNANLVNLVSENTTPQVNLKVNQRNENLVLLYINDKNFFFT